MTEKEKAYAGLLYDASDPELAAERAKAKKLCTKYNRLKPLKVKKRKKLIKKLFGEIGKYSLVEQPFYCDYGNHIKAGKNFFVNFNCVMLDVAGITFGDNVLIAPNCGFYTVGHPFSIEQRCICLETAGPIVVGNNVWIGGNTAVMPGVTIGDNTVIGAGSIVTKSVPANKLAYGNPCRVIRELTEEELGFKK